MEANIPMKLGRDDGAGTTTGCGTSKRSLEKGSGVEQTQEPLRSSSDSGSYVDPGCLLALHITTAGKQGEDLGSDELPIVMISAKIIDFCNPELEDSEFQTYIRPDQFEVNWNALSGTDSNEPLKADQEEYHNLDIDWNSVSKEGSVTLTDGAAVPSCLHLSHDCITATGLTDEFLVDGKSLSDGLWELHSWLQDHGLFFSETTYERQEGGHIQPTHTQPSKPQHPNELVESNTKHARMQEVYKEDATTTAKTQGFLILTDGPPGLRLVLHPETTKRSICLKEFPYLYHYIDIRKSVKNYCHMDALPGCLDEMMSYVGINLGTLQSGSTPPIQDTLDEISFVPPNGQNTAWIEEGMECSSGEADLPNDTHPAKAASDSKVIDVSADYSQFIDVRPGNESSSFCAAQIGQPQMEHCRILGKLALHMHANGFTWTEVEHIHDHYQPSIVRKSEVVDDGHVIRARGLPWQATDLDIFHFFSGLNISNGGISLVLSKIGRRNGEALIRFTDQEQRDLALRKHKHHMGQRYVEVYAAQGREFVAFAGAETTEAEEFLKKFTSPYQALIRMRGLPYATTVQQVLEFFSNTDCAVQFGEEGVLFVNRRNGRATGDAFVIFENQAIGEKALQNHWQHIGNRYIELFKSTPAEVNQVMNAVLNPPLTLPRSWNKITVDVKSALTAAALAAGVLPGVVGSPSSTENCSTGDPAIASLTQLNFTAQQPLNLGYQLLGSQGLPGSYGPYSQPNGLFFSPVPYQPLPVPPLDPILCNMELFNPFGNMTVNQTLIPGSQVSADQLTTKLSGITGSMNFTFGCPSLANVVSGTVNIPQQPPLINYNNLPQSALSTLGMSIEQLARCFVRIRGMPVDADIIDILTFLEDSWRHVALHGVHQVYNTAGQPTGEAIIQFVSEVVARWVAEQKNNQPFIKRGVQLCTSTSVEVSQCTCEHLKQLLATVVNMMQAGGASEALGSLRTAAVPNCLTGLVPKTSWPQFSSPSNIFPGAQGWMNLSAMSPVTLPKDLRAAGSANHVLGTVPNQIMDTNQDGVRQGCSNKSL
ncbi:RNA-binding protein fusilli [Clonorchis sinensis]|uniref:RNA-binding protein fusilli n=1 Tax=Clonorchis sinensis TaxID=79923 RepID=A0A8T1M3G8_CLOSI|nr:RNA-binding protein fusilli [Clonorchis sinensis]